MSLVLANKTLISRNPRRKTSISPPTFLKPKPIHNDFQEQLIQRKPACPCGGGCPRCNEHLKIKPKLKINDSGDRYEQEADRIADQIMRMPDEEVLNLSFTDTEVQRKCASCASGGERCSDCEDEEGVLMQRGVQNDDEVSDPAIPDDFLQNLGPGKPLDPKTQAYFEPRFGYDFSQVRVHSDMSAAESAQAVNARAFTVGHDMVFGMTEYAPEKIEGKRLLAHELTHTIQQNSPTGVKRIQRQEFVPAPGQLGAETGRRTEGDVIHVSIDRTVTCGSVYHLQLDFDHRNCLIVTPMSVRFIHPPEPNRRLSVQQFDALADRFVEVANNRLNGWYAIRISGAEPGCTAPCRNQDLPIQVQVTRSQDPTAYPITLVNDSGRSTAGTFYAGDLDEWTLWHEAGHIALGISDEYREAGVACREGEHATERDWSVMASSSDFRARAVMHPRHFSHILNWFETEYPNCTITMPALERPTIVDTTLRLETGAGMLGGRFARYDRLILEHGFPLDAARRVRLMMGAAFEDIESSDDRVALLFGLTLGLEAATSRSAGGFNIGIESMIGGGLLGRPGELTTSGVAVFEAGAHLGYAGPRFEIGLAGRVGVPLSGPEERNPYLLAGIRFGYNFYLP